MHCGRGCSLRHGGDKQEQGQCEQMYGCCGGAVSCRSSSSFRRMAMALALLVAVACAAEAHENPYLHGNQTVCPGRWSMYVFRPCGGQGTCDTTTGECQCFTDFRGPDCSYPLRSRRTAFILSFLLGTWGAGRLYLGLIGMGIVQVRVPGTRALDGCGLILSFVLSCWAWRCCCLCPVFRCAACA